MSGGAGEGRAGRGEGGGAAPRGRVLRMGLQLAGFLAGLASLAWCVSLALRPENEAQFKKLAGAPAHLILAMLGLSMATVVINGALFWAAGRVVRPLRFGDVQAINALCMFLSYLPLKAGAVARVLIHNRRDRIPLLTIGAWFAAMVVTMGAAIVPLFVATVRHGRPDAWWAAEVLAMEAALCVLLIGAARLFRGERGAARLRGAAGRLRFAPLDRLLVSRAWVNLHQGFDIIASPPSTAGSFVLRLMDAAVHCGRFMVAAHILGVGLPLREALPVSLTFFLVGVVSPSGLAGLREGAATGLAGLLLAKTGAHDDTFRVFAAVALLVTANEAIVFLLGAALGVAWLRPDRLLRLRRGAGVCATCGHAMESVPEGGACPACGAVRGEAGQERAG